MTKKINKQILVSTLIFSSIILIGSAWFVYPIPGSDAISFVPASVSFARGEGFINPIYSLACETDPAGLCRYCFHMPLFPWLAGIIAKIHPTTQMVFLAIAGLGILLLFALYKQIISIQQKLKNSKTFIILSGLILLSVTFYKLPTIGRPELLSSLLIFLIWILFKYDDSFQIIIIRILLLGMLMATHAVGFIIVSAFILYYYTVKNNITFSNLIIKGTIHIVPGIIVFLLIMLISPNGLSDSIKGIVDHWLLVQKDRSDTSILLLLKYWILNPEGFMFGLLFCLSAFLWLKENFKLYSQLKQFQIVLSSIIVLFITLFIYIFALRSAPTVYNISQFYPVLCIYILQQIGLSQSNSGYQRKLLVLSTVLFSLSLVYPARNIYLFFNIIREGKTFANAKNEIKPYLESKEPLVVSWQLWCLTDDYSQIQIWDEQKSQKGDITVQQQARGEIPLKITNEYTLIQDWRCPTPDKIMGIQISNRPQGYSFSVWQNK